MPVPGARGRRAEGCVCVLWACACPCAGPQRSGLVRDLLCPCHSLRDSVMRTRGHVGVSLCDSLHMRTEAPGGGVGGCVPTAGYLGMILSPLHMCLETCTVSLCTHNSDWAGWE